MPLKSLPLISCIKRPIFNLIMKKYSYFFIFLTICFSCFAQPGKNGALTVSAPNQILNQYIPVSVNIAAGSSVVTIANSSLFSICPGDLIMIYQAQGASMDITNTSSYGNITNYNSAGLYEFKYVQSVSGNNVTTQTTFTNSYAVAGRVQLIKVPQYTNLTINGGASIVPKPWKDTTIAATPYRFGGLVVVHATNITNNGTITATSNGFRGGALVYDNSINLGITLFRGTLINQGGEKGEGICGYQTDYDLLGGRYCMGAPANGGGGGNSHNAGGGGGGNGFNGNTWNGYGVMIVNATNPLAGWSIMPGYIANGNALTNSSGGGHGGCAYADANGNALVHPPGNAAWIGDVRRDVGGFGGRPLTNINPETRIYFGGGGGAAHANNNASSPATNGGGIVYLIATTGITGNGTISSNALTAGNASICSCDAAPGGGAGGSIVLKTGAIAATQVVTADGGKGGNQLTITPPGSFYESEGPGGGGSGGFVAISSGAVIPSVLAGTNGTTVSNALTEMPSNGATEGATGQTAPVTTNFIAFIPIAPITVSASNNGPLCVGSTLVLTTTVAANSYTWTGPNAANSSSQNYSITNVSPSAAGIYSVQFNFGSCFTPATATTQVTINNSPTITLSNTIVCSGQSINLNPTVNTATSYTWAGPNSFSANTPSVSIPNALTNAGGAYTLTGSNANGCISTAIANVTVTPTPTISLLSNSPVCEGAALNFTTSGAASYSLNGPNAFSSTLVNPSINTISLAGAGIYTLTGSTNGCIDSITNTVSVNTIPTITLNANSFCSGQAIGLNPSVSSATAYSWSGPNSFNASTQNFTITNSSSVNAGIYTLTATNINGCSAIASASISIVQSPTINVAGSSVCINQPININCNTNGFSFSWSGPNGFSSAAQTISFSNASFSLSGAYNVTVTSAQGCTNTAIATVSVYPLPTPTLSSNSPVCVGGTLNLLGGGGNTFSYSGPNGFTSTLQNPSITNVTSAANGVYTLTAINFGCSASVTLSVSIFSSNAGTLTVSDNEKCIPFCPSFSINTNGLPANTATLNVNGQLFTGNPVNYCITTAGNYTANSIFKDANGCINTSTIVVTGYPKPDADFIFSPLKPVENIDEVIFTNTSTGINQIAWNWFFNDNNGFTSINQNTFYLYQTAGAYPVAMIVKNVWGCADTVVKIVTIGNEYTFYVPNAFTPDGDGINDVFYPKGTGIIKYELMIFDRWGELLFTTKDFYKGWDGTYKGMSCKTDTYTWKINVNDSEGRNREYVGHVTLYK